MKRRVAITGLGVVSSAGIGKDKFWENFKQGKSCTHRTTRFDPSPFKSQVASEILDFNPLDYMEKTDLKKTDLSTHFALAATKMALEDAQLNIENIDTSRIGISMGMAVFGVDFTEKQMLEYYKGKGLRGVSPFTVIAVYCCAPLGHISINYGITGWAETFSNGCTAGIDAIGSAMQAIREGKADIIIAGGTEAPITPIVTYSFDVVHCLSRKRNNQPEKASRPFDKDRDGFVLGEGCGLLILEELEHAKKRGVEIYAEIAGYGNTCNAYHMTAPAPDGIQAANAAKIAMEEGEIKPQDVDYISAHGSSTPLNEKAETKAIKEILGNHAYKVAISSIKSMIGHPLGAAGGLQTIATALSIKEGIIPPTINYEYPDPDCDLDYVPNKARTKEIEVALVNGFGFSGKNAVIVLKKYKGIN